jgi:transposase-like protein
MLLTLRQPASHMSLLSFKGRHTPKAMILMAVRWYVASAWSYRNIEERMSERGI